MIHVFIEVEFVANEDFYMYQIEQILAEHQFYFKIDEQNQTHQIMMNL
jgi:hypothetical protein